MGRNNVDFYSGQGFHFAHKRHRDSIEKHGLRITPAESTSMVHEPGDIPRGVYMYRDLDAVDYVAGGGSGYPNHDVYQVHIPVQHLEEDPWLPDDAVYSDNDVPRNMISRVGHVTSEGKLHWHPEEECNGKK